MPCSYSILNSITLCKFYETNLSWQSHVFQNKQSATQAFTYSISLEKLEKVIKCVKK